MKKLRVALVGRHANRTPLSYPVYRQLFEKKVRFVEDVYSADAIILGYSIDIESITSNFPGLIKNRPDLRFLVISEEPLWDSLSPNVMCDNEVIWHTSEGSVNIEVINHVTSTVFDFSSIPYFLTTNSSYIARYIRSFQWTLNNITPSALLSQWKRNKGSVVFMQQYRNSSEYNYSNSSLGVMGLSRYRSFLGDKIANKTLSNPCVALNNSMTRQQLPDWHLDKITRLRGTYSYLSCIENTLLNNYLTEKIFDAFATGNIPLYYANPEHRVFEFVDGRVVLNLFGLSVPESDTFVREHHPTLELANLYMDNVEALYNRFANFNALHKERERVVNSIYKLIT